LLNLEKSSEILRPSIAQLSRFPACHQAGMRIFSSLNHHAADPDNYRDGG